MAKGSKSPFGQASDDLDRLDEQVKKLNASLDPTLWARQTTLLKAKLDVDERAKKAMEAIAGTAENLAKVQKEQVAAAKFSQGLANTTGSVASQYGRGVGILQSTVGQSNPAELQQMQRAFADLGAVVGQILLPVMVRFTAAVRGFADAIINLDPAMKALAGDMFGAGLAGAAATKGIAMLTGPLASAATLIPGVGPAISGVLSALPLVGGAFVGLLESTKEGRSALADLGRAFAALWRALQPFILWLAKQAAEFARFVAKVVLAATPETAASGGNKSSVGAAAGRASYVSISDLGRNLSLAAAQSGAKSAVEQTADNTQKTTTILEDIFEFFVGGVVTTGISRGIRGH